MNKDQFKQCVIFWLVMISVLLSKAVSSADLEISQSPLAVKDTAPPNVMLAMSRDHQLYIKAYTDYSDLDHDGILDTTYNNNVDYYGYFDSNTCYTYASNLFGPVRPARRHQCIRQWSGNFLNWATMTRMDIIRKVLYGGYRSTDNTYENGGATILERTMIPFDAHAFVKVFSPSSTAEMLNYTPYAQQVISICNLTQGTGLSKEIDTNSYPPMMRVAKGSAAGDSGWPGWAASATRQCQWADGTLLGALPGSAYMLDELNVRVNVCVSRQEETNCKSYFDKYSTDPNTPITKKPAGLLQKYWESDKPIYFGLMTGSWGNNRSGGVLRAVTQGGSNEINANDGTFTSPYPPSHGGIIATLNRFRISGYQFTNKRYVSDTDWGNPLSEIYLETLRYLAGKGSPTEAFDTDDSAVLPPLTASYDLTYELNKKDWNSPIGEGNWCAKCSIIAISAGANSFDTDELTNDLGIDAVGQTNTIGGSDKEGINGNRYLVGSSTGSTDISADNNKNCTGKTVSSLSAAQGICPEAPSLEGGYHIAGLAYYARIHDFFGTDFEVRNPLHEDEVYFSGVQSMNTYSIALSESLPRFEIPVDGVTITILPACEAYDSSLPNPAWKPCGLVDLRVENLHYNSNNKLASGSFTVVWEDATSGSDYDMDGIERLAFSVSSGKIKITTSLISSDSPKDMHFGYTISGSNDDGIKLPVLRPGSSTNPLPNAVESEYSKGGASAKLLENPLWYAAKYGGFETIDKAKEENPVDQTTQSWDEDVNGIPDAFFKATNPALLESALDIILNKVASKLASSASVAANSTRLDTSAALYQAKFSPAGWNGQLLAYKIDATNGNITSTPSWDAGKEMTDQGSGRFIFSYNDDSKAGILFEYNSLSDAQKQLLTVDQFNYIKGDQSKEQPNGTLRKRTGDNRLMGDIVNSDPKFINTISQGYDSLPGVEGKDYLKYITSPALRGRDPMLAVGANDGMLHVFNASLDKAKGGGKEILAYVPSTILSNLKYLTLPTYIVNGKHKYFVDGSPEAGDAYFDANGNDSSKEWRTALAGTMGAGGKGVFALDLTFLSPNDYMVTESFSASRVLWEINDRVAPLASDLADDFTGSTKRYGFTNYLGVTLGQASIVRIMDDVDCKTNKKGKFVAVFGNGYNSKEQTAVLYIVDIKTGHLIRSITTGVGDTTTVNGLATPLTVDANGDRIVDAIYAGDYLGNMWKFDVSNCNPDNWKVAFTSSTGQPAPLFKTLATSYITPNNPPVDGDYTVITTTIPRPITAKPESDLHPKGGVMVYFGTGKYFLNVDNLIDVEQDPVETFYGIWDECVNYAGGTASCDDHPISGNAKLEKSQLVQQTIIQEEVNNRATSRNPVDYLTKKGWYMDLYKGNGYVTGERVVSQAIIRNRRIIFSTIYPDALARLCVSGGNSWLMLLDALTGNSLDVSAFLSNGGSSSSPEVPISINVNGVSTAVSGVKLEGVGMIDTPTLVDTKGEKEKLVGCGSSGNCKDVSISKLLGGRQSWVQIR